MKYYIGIDLGGTNIVAGVVDEQFQLIAKASEKTLVGRPAIEIGKSCPHRRTKCRCPNGAD